MLSVIDYYACRLYNDLEKRIAYRTPCLLFHLSKENETNEYKGYLPKLLYGYYNIDDNLFKMLDSNEIQLSEYSKLDNKMYDISLLNLVYDYDKNKLRVNLIDLLCMALRPYTTEEGYNKTKEVLMSCINAEGYIISNRILNAYDELKGYYSEDNIDNLIDYLNYYANSINDSEIDNNLIKLRNLIDELYYASFYYSANCIDVLDDRSNGVIIEYKISGYKHNDILYPIDYYSSGNILTVALDEELNSLKYSNNKYDILFNDEYNAKRVFFSRGYQYRYQEEWMLVGGSKALALPKINKIIIGSKVGIKDRDRLIELSKANKIRFEIAKY